MENKIPTHIIKRRPLGNPNRVWRQDNFVVSTFKAETERVRLGLQEAKELNFNLVEFGWVSPERSLECMTACEEVGIDGVFQNWEAFGGFQESKGGRETDPEVLNKYIAYTKKFRHVAGYYVWDEPLDDEKIREAAKQVKMMESLDPDRIPFTVAIPSYNGKFYEYLNKYADTIEPAVMSLDYYPFSPRRPLPADQLDSCKLFLDIALLRKIAKRKNIPMWFYFQSQDDPAKGTYKELSEEKIRMQQFNALLYGAKGLQNYNIAQGALWDDASRGPLYYFTRDINHRSLMMGRTFMALTSTHVFHSPEVLKDNPAFDEFREDPSASKVLAPEPLPFRASVGEFEDSENNVYLFIQNRDLFERRVITLRFNAPYRLYEVDQRDGYQFVASDSADSLTLNLSAGDARLFRLQDPAQSPCFIDYVLEK